MKHNMVPVISRSLVSFCARPVDENVKQVTKTRLDPSWTTVAEKAQELVSGWAEASQRMVSSISISVSSIRKASQARKKALERGDRQLLSLTSLPPFRVTASYRCRAESGGISHDPETYRVVLCIERTARSAGRKHVFP